MKDAVVELLELGATAVGWIRRFLVWFEPFGVALAVVGLFLAVQQLQLDAETRREDREMRATTLYVMALERLDAAAKDVEAGGAGRDMGQIRLLQEMRDAGVDLNGLDARGGVSFTRINLDGASLRGGVFDDAEFFAASLRGTDFSSASLRGATIRNSNIEGASFFNADLTGAKIEFNKLAGADFAVANVSNAEFKMRGLPIDLRGAIYFKGAEPKGLGDQQMAELDACDEEMIDLRSACALWFLGLTVPERAALKIPRPPW